MPSRVPPQVYLPARRLGAACAVLAVGLMAQPAALQAQSAGVELTFDLSQRIEASENRALAATSAGTTLQAVTGLGLGLVAETRTSRLGIDLGSSLTLTRNADGTTSAELASPRLSFGYSRSAANSSLNLGGSFRQDDIAFLRPLGDFLDEDGQIVLPDDLDELNGTGTRRNVSGNARLSFGDAGPVGLTLSAGVGRTDYINASNAALFDNRRLDLGAELRLDLNAVTSARLGVSWSRFEDDDPTSDTRVSTGISGGIDFARPNGTLGATFSTRRSDDGTGLSLGINRSIELPRGTLAGNLGFSRDADGKTRMNGGLRYSQELPSGQINLGINRATTLGSDDTDRLTTAISLGLTHQLTQVSSLSANLNYVDSARTASGLSTTTASFGLGYTRQMTRDWGLTAGYQHDLRDDGTRATSDTIFVQLGRSFQFGF